MAGLRSRKTPTGKPIIDEVILKDWDGSSDDVPADFDDNEDVGMISEGENAWLS